MKIKKVEDIIYVISDITKQEFDLLNSLGAAYTVDTETCRLTHAIYYNPADGNLSKNKTTFNKVTEAGFMAIEVTYVADDNVELSQEDRLKDFVNHFGDALTAFAEVENTYKEKAESLLARQNALINSIEVCNLD